MIINQSVGFTFIHIPKSAGTSVTQFLSGLNGPFDIEIGGTVFGEDVQSAYWKRFQLRKHTTLAEARNAINIARPQTLMFIFSFVRNPYARLLSTFFFLRKWQHYDPNLLSIMKSFADVEEFLESGIYRTTAGPDRIFRPQSDWLSEAGRIATDVSWFKIEEPETSLNSLRKILIEKGANSTSFSKELPHTNRSQPEQPAYEVLPESLLRDIEEYYEADFRNFNYTMLSRH